MLCNHSLNCYYYFWGYKKVSVFILPVFITSELSQETSTHKIIYVFYKSKKTFRKYDDYLDPSLSMVISCGAGFCPIRVIVIFDRTNLNFWQISVRYLSKIQYLKNCACRRIAVCFLIKQDSHMVSSWTVRWCRMINLKTKC